MSTRKGIRGEYIPALRSADLVEMVRLIQGATVKKRGRIAGVPNQRLKLSELRSKLEEFQLIYCNPIAPPGGLKRGSHRPKLVGEFENGATAFARQPWAIRFLASVWNKYTGLVASPGNKDYSRNKAGDDEWRPGEFYLFARAGVRAMQLNFRVTWTLLRTALKTKVVPANIAQIRKTTDDEFVKLWRRWNIDGGRDCTVDFEEEYRVEFEDRYHRLTA